MCRTIGALAVAAMLASGTAAAQDAVVPPNAAKSSRSFYDQWSLYVSDTTVSRFIVNECIIAGVGAVTVTVLLAATPMTPLVAVAVGALPEYSALTVGALGCAGGVAAGVASAAVAWVWEEQDTVGQVMVAGATEVWRAAVSAGTTMAAIVDGTVRGTVDAGQVMLASLGEATTATFNATMPPVAAPLRASYDVASISARVGDEVWVY